MRPMVRNTVILIGMVAWASLTLTGCVYPGISLNKGRLLDPTMDPAKTDSLSDWQASWAQSRMERSSITNGGSSGSACPTCR
jgi:hypothetical protein